MTAKEPGGNIAETESQREGHEGLLAQGEILDETGDDFQPPSGPRQVPMAFEGRGLLSGVDQVTLGNISRLFSPLTQPLNPKQHRHPDETKRITSMDECFQPGGSPPDAFWSSTRTQLQGKISREKLFHILENLIGHITIGRTSLGVRRFRSSWGRWRLSLWQKPLGEARHTGPVGRSSLLHVPFRKLHYPRRCYSLSSPSAPSIHRKVSRWIAWELGFWNTPEPRMHSRLMAPPRPSRVVHPAQGELIPGKR